MDIQEKKFFLKFFDSQKMGREELGSNIYQLDVCEKNSDYRR